MKNYLDYLSVFSSYVPFIAGLLIYKILTREMKALTLLFGAGVISDLISILALHLHITSLGVINIFSIIEVFILFYILREWQYKQWMKKVAVVLLIVNFVIWCNNCLISGNFLFFNDKEKSIKAICLIFLSAFPMIGFSLDDEVSVWKNYKFWICSAILVYSSVSVVVYCTSQLLINNVIVMGFTWAFYSVVNILSNFIFAYGYLWYYRKEI